MEPVVDVIRDLLVDKFGVFGTEMHASTTLEELDIDSLVLVELSVVLSRRYGVRLYDDDLVDQQTIGEVAALVEAKLATV